MHSNNKDQESDDDWESDTNPLDSGDSDAEIQEAFAKGILKPGLNLLRPYDDTAPKKKTFVNNVAELQRRLEEIKTDLPWIERLDLISEQAPMAPELAHQISEHKLSRENQLKQVLKPKKKRNAPPAPSIEEDPIHNDFKREMTFFRQAQSAAMRGLEKLKQLAIPSKRPTDYFAQMVKTDNHMQKVRKLLTRQKISSELSEKARELRQQRKMSKEVQKDVLQKRQSEKKKLLEAVKRYRKGHKDALEYLENDLGELGLKGTTEMFDESKGNKSKSSKGNKNKSPAKGNAQQSNRQKKKSQKKRDFKQKKFGFGGQKKRSKQNTRESTNMSRSKGKGKMANKRPGKDARKTMKGKRR